MPESPVKVAACSKVCHGARGAVRVARCDAGLACNLHAKVYVFVVYLCVLYGAFQSYGRALYAEVIRPGEEARWWFGLSIADKVTTL